ncbi:MULTISPECIES: dihydroorotase [Clostridia]|uniref:dihydroorotase n=1 Tax=Clostridia TaxID=186801 RepID=UPI000EA2B4EE|nr:MULTISPECIES: dihydroorotase [Clostridia]NBJ68472.1 dihydroorotase [Roseburia sp. 1XD42-34]RKI81232.1 dihydroorotase [Clostridium sp. 1xD42-85]
MKQLIKNIKHLLPTGELVKRDILIENDKITKLAPIIKEEADREMEGSERLAVPGFMDVHIHLREPGDEHKETIITGTKAAARGGYTTVCAMPNTNPVPDTVERVRALHQRIDNGAVVRVLPYASITKQLQGKELTDIPALAQTGIFAFTDDGVGIQSTHQMLQAMKLAKANNKAIVAHCEDNSIVYGGVVHDGEVSERLDIPGIPSLAESVQIARDVLIAETTGCHYHVCHVSTKESVRVIRDAKKAGIHVTAEVTPHHLLLNESDITTADTNFKMNPPLRAKEDQEALLAGLLDGTIDFIATDHAPHASHEKEQGMLRAPFGIVGLEHAFSLLYTHLVLTEKVTLEQLIAWMALKPAATFGLPYGRLLEGSLADITLIDLQKSITIDKNSFYSKGKNTPFHGWSVQGVPTLTMVAGKIVYEVGK